ncbi:MAG: carboxypeptidase M32, partial [Chloroflexi bacterium]|nr:carboxypeptidase M32 [Chloroflexota bacterium]
MATTAELLAELQAVSSEMIELGRVERLQSWDQETMMPPKGTADRARQRAAIQGLLHERLTRPRVGELLAALAEPAAGGQLSQVDAAVVREVQREYDLAVKLPNEFVRELAQATTEGVDIWRRARQESRFADFAPALEHIVQLKQAEADYLGWADHAYDALLDQYEPGLTVARLTPLFADLRRSTGELLGRLSASTVQPDSQVLEQEYDLTTQWEIGLMLVQAIGFDLEAGRVDRTTHPFATGLGPGDVRLTTRQRPDNLAEIVFGNLHEGGHGLYEQGLDPDLAGTIAGQYVSLGIHESQSRLWENFVGRDLPFWRFALPRLQAAFPVQLGAVTTEQ